MSRLPTRTARRLPLLLACLAGLHAGPAAADPTTLGLPPEPLLRQALLQAPQADAADAAWQAERAAAGLVRLGPNDWVLRAGLQRRSERTGSSFAEREIALERTLRWGNKPALDGQLADQALDLARRSHQAAWQDAASTLLGLWFDALRDQQARQHQQAQLRLAAAQVAALQRRVSAGDAALLALRQAEGEHARTSAALASAEQRASTSRQALQRRYPALAGQPLDTALAPQPLDPALAGQPPAAPAAPATNTAAYTAANTAAQQAVAQQVLLQHPALAAAQAQATLARLQLGRLEADRRPDPTVALRFAQERGGAEQVLGLTVAIPFGSALRDQRVQAGAAAWSAAQAQVRALQAQLAADADRIAAAPAQASHVAGRLQAAAQAAQTSARLTERAQAAGEATLAELLQQHRQAGDAALAAALAQVDALEAQARLALALQQLLPAPAPSATQPAP